MVTPVNNYLFITYVQHIYKEKQNSYSATIQLIADGSTTFFYSSRSLELNIF